MHIFNWEVGEEMLKTFRREMLVKPQAQLLGKGNGFKDFIQDKKYEQMKLLYKLYKQEPEHLKAIGDQFKQFIAEQGKAMLKQVELHNKDGKLYEIKEIIATSQVVTKLLDMLSEYTGIVVNCFESNSSFEIQRAQGFEQFVNFEIGQYTLAEILATYTDNVLRKNGLKVTHEEFEQQLERVVRLFAHLTDKDIFI